MVAADRRDSAEATAHFILMLAGQETTE